ncbi:nuclease-related domain-containing protein [Virgibacillus tibetensis]
MLLKLFKKKKPTQSKENSNKSVKQSKSIKEQEHIAVRKGEIGEYKINIQLDQLPKEYKYLSDLMIENQKSVSRYSQIDHVVLSPYGIFVIETKNYQGTIYGGKNRKQWSVNGKFKMVNPFHQNYGHIEALKSLLDKKFHSSFISIVSFTKRCTFKIDVELRKITANELIVYDVELSDFISRKVNVLKLTNKEKLLTEEEMEEIYMLFHDANIEDKALRDQHNNCINNKKSKDIKSPQKRCVQCNQSVSDKVAAFCLSNKKFAGKIYCYKHQKG